MRSINALMSWNEKSRSSGNLGGSHGGEACLSGPRCPPRGVADGDRKNTEIAAEIL
jgi:hypothetical protein